MIACLRDKFADSSYRHQGRPGRTKNSEEKNQVGRCQPHQETITSTKTKGTTKKHQANIYHDMMEFIS